MTIEHSAFASMSMLPHADTVEARATAGSAVRAAKISAVGIKRAWRIDEVFIRAGSCNR
jgi:hypothetical protein